MKNLNDILKLLNLPKNTENNRIANNYKNILSLINEVKKDIKNVEILENDQKININTSFGIYTISLPMQSDFYNYICVLLNIESSYKKPAEVLNIENTIFVENTIIESLNKALKFTDIKNLYDLSNNIYLKFENDFIEVLSTNGALIYCSQKFNYISDQNINNSILSIPIQEIKNFKNLKNEFLKIDILENNFILIDDNKIELSNINTNPINNFNFNIQNEMIFNKMDFQKNIKSLKSLLDYRKSIKFHLNGSIEIQPLTENQNNKTILKMNYDSKNFDDKDYIFRFENINNIISSFRSKKLILSTKNINNKDLALITDNTDSFLIINQLNF